MYICKPTFTITKQMNETTTAEPTTEEKVIVAFRCSPEMQQFINDEAGEESVSVLLRTWVREKMEAKRLAQAA